MPWEAGNARYLIATTGAKARFMGPNGVWSSVRFGAVKPIPPEPGGLNHHTTPNHQLRAIYLKMFCFLFLQFRGQFYCGYE